MNKEIQLYILEDISYKYSIVSLPFRVFYNLNNDEKTPHILRYSHHSKIPDYPLFLLETLLHAYQLYIQKYQLDNPLKKGIYFEQGAKFIDVMLVSIPTQKGLVTAELIDNSQLFPKEPLMHGRAIKILLDNNLIENSATPIHELFHVFQYNYCSFNNMWFMEGLARWSQNITHKRKMIHENLPQTLESLQALTLRAHESEYFWRQLFSFVDDEQLFIKKLLEESQKQGKILEKELNYKPNNWTKQQKKGQHNNQYIFQAILNSLNQSLYKQEDEIKNFISLLEESLKHEYTIFNTPQIQRFLEVLQKCDATLVHTKENILYSPYFDIQNKKLTTPNLVCATLNEYEFDALNIIKEIDGNLTIGSNIKSLNGFNYLTTLKNLTISNIDSLKEILGFNALKNIESLEISYNKNLETIFGFNTLFQNNHELSGFLKIINNKKLSSISFLKGIKKVASSLYLHHNGLKNLEGLEFLESVGASFSLSSNNLENISALLNLKSVNGMLGLSYNNLSTLHGLENLEFLKTTLWNGENRTINIAYNKNLFDILPLSNIKTIPSYIIMHLDNPKQYTKKPNKNTPFTQNILELYVPQEKKIVPTYEFILKESHDYKNFRATTHDKKLTHIFDFQTPADTLIISFSGFNGFLGGIFHNRFNYIMQNIKTHKIFIHDLHNSWYHHKIGYLFTNIEDIIKIIQQLLEGKNYKTILCIGASMGGYMALLVGAIIKASHIIAFSPQTFLDAKNREKYQDTRWEKALKNISHEYQDLQLVYQNIDTTSMDIQIHYAKNLQLDALHAKHLQNNTIKLISYDTNDHHLAVYLHNKGGLEAIIMKALTIKHYQNHKLLMGHNWSKATSPCLWLEPHHMAFQKVTTILEYCKENSIKILFANNYATHFFIKQNEKLLKENGLKFIVNSRRFIKSVGNKQRFYDILVANNFAKYTPKYYTLQDTIPFPCIVKIKKGSGGGKGVALVYNKEAIDATNENLLICDYLPSNVEYATTIFSKDGVVLKDITYSKTASKQNYVLQQESNIQTKREATQFLELFMQIIEVFNPAKGYCQCSINYKIENNIPKIFEINPRMGYTLAGFCPDFKEMIDIYVNELDT